MTAMSNDDQSVYTYQEPKAPDRTAITSDAKTWGMLCHLSAFAGYVIPFGNIVGPLIVWQLKKDEYEFVDDQGKESVNFQITITIATIISAVLFIVLIGIFLLPVILLFDLIMKIIAAVKASNGERFRYPLTIRMIN
jgi:uncharacterized Tic20 family protein